MYSSPAPQIILIKALMDFRLSEPEYLYPASVKVCIFTHTCSHMLCSASHWINQTQQPLLMACVNQLHPSGCRQGWGAWGAATATRAEPSWAMPLSPAHIHPAATTTNSSLSPAGHIAARLRHWAAQLWCNNGRDFTFAKCTKVDFVAVVFPWQLSLEAVFSL